MLRAGYFPDPARLLIVDLSLTFDLRFRMNEGLQTPVSATVSIRTSLAISAPHNTQASF